MSSFSLQDSGSWKSLEKMLRQMSQMEIGSMLESAGAKGVAALAANTPADSGLTANSWSYEVKKSGQSATITWTNTNINDGFEVAVSLDYGYSTGTGGWVPGRPYINAAMQPIFDEITNTVWKAVTAR